METIKICCNLDSRISSQNSQMLALAIEGSKGVPFRREDVRKDPVFRAQFHTMCANVGVDPLASNKGMWTQLLGFGDFYYELGVQVVEACLASKPMNGGLMDIDSLQMHVTVSYVQPLYLIYPLSGLELSQLSAQDVAGKGASPELHSC